jgi:CBS domain-containing protein
MLWRSSFQFISYVRSNQGLEDHGRDRFPFFDVHESDNLLKAIGKIGATKSHRIWVVDQANKPVGVVSLSDCLRALLPKQQQE